MPSSLLVAPWAPTSAAMSTSPAGGPRCLSLASACARFGWRDVLLCCARLRREGCVPPSPVWRLLASVSAASAVSSRSRRCACSACSCVCSVCSCARRAAAYSAALVPAALPAAAPTSPAIEPASEEGVEPAVAAPPSQSPRRMSRNRCTSTGSAHSAYPLARTGHATSKSPRRKSGRTKSRPEPSSPASQSAPAPSLWNRTRTSLAVSGAALKKCKSSRSTSSTARSALPFPESRAPASPTGAVLGG
mmetsp:Transcript_6252/g.16311  ORF Transcript_6252/g.16311 Transcript_6252/m.16311 type:complete len:248 (-) Transcript_6252:882-1625(-)